MMLGKCRGGCQMLSLFTQARATLILVRWPRIKTVNYSCNNNGCIGPRRGNLKKVPDYRMFLYRR